MSKVDSILHPGFVVRRQKIYAYLAMSFDYVIVGAGSTGSAIAGRLSEDGRNRVLLLEAGGSDRRPTILIPAAAMLWAFGNPRYDWRFTAEPDPTRNGRRDYMPRGKLLGGTSSINAMSFFRGNPNDYDGWAELGCRGWDFKSVLPYFKRLENFENGADEFRGVGGPLSVSHLRSRHPLSKAFVQSSVNAGMAFKEDINTPPQDGVGYVQATQHKGWRHSAARAYVWPAMRRRNLAVHTRAHALRLCFEGKKAVGVDYLHRGRTVRADASKAVILSAGTFGSPQLLMLSGVGPAAHLREHGIDMVHDLSGVGENLQDHAGANCTAWVNRTTYNMQTGLLNYLIYGSQWLLTGTGPASSPVAQVGGFCNNKKPELRSRIQYLFTPGGYDLAEEGPILFDKPAVTGLANVHRPYSSGWLRLKSGDPADAPAIHPNLFGDDRDVETLLQGTKFLRSIMATEPLSHYVVGEHMPGKDVQSDDEWRAYLRATATGVYHPSGTCKMGHDAMAVVDDSLRVHGLESLYVADASIMPFVVSANLNATCIMIGEKASDMILQAS